MTLRGDGRPPPTRHRRTCSPPHLSHRRTCSPPHLSHRRTCSPPHLSHRRTRCGDPRLRRATVFGRFPWILATSARMTGGESARRTARWPASTHHPVIAHALPSPFSSSPHPLPSHLRHRRTRCGDPRLRAPPSASVCVDPRDKREEDGPVAVLHPPVIAALARRPTSVIAALARRPTSVIAARVAAIHVFVSDRLRTASRGSSRQARG